MLGGAAPLPHLIFISLLAFTTGQLQFIETPSDVNVTAGDSTTLPCVAMGADVVYVWLKGGMALALTMNESSRVHLDNGSLVINDVMEDDDDEYVCIVLNIDTAENITSEVAYLTVLFITIVQSPSNSTVVNGSEVLLHCVARGDVNITYEWYRNDTLLSAHQVLENGSLVITEADYLHDNGFYTCRATGNHGSTLTSTPAYLQVYYLEKVFVEVSGNISAVRGDIIRIPCEPPVGIPPVDVLSWLHDSKPIKEDDRIILRHRKLTISEAEVGDSGFYQCVANNGNFVRTSGQFYVRVSLTAACHPVSLPDQINKKVYGVIGQPVMLECTPTGTNVSITWMRSGSSVVVVPGDVEVFTSGVLRFSSYRDNQAGDYTCLVTNHCGGHDHSASNEVGLVTATISDTFRQPLPMEQVAGLHSHFNLTCSPPNADPPPVVSWMYNGVPLVTGLHHHVTNNSVNYTLNVTDVLLSNAANYSCRAESIAGVRLSTVVITVLEPPMVVVNDVEVKLEDVAMVTCLSSSPYTTAMLWRYHGEVLSNSSKYVITNGNNMSILQVMNVERNDFGSYRCDVIDSVHKTTFAIGYLNHTRLLYFTHKINRTKAVVGTRATLTCTVSGMVGMVTFLWFKDGRGLDEDNNYDINVEPFSTDDYNISSQLTVKNVTLQDNGNFSCKAKDTANNQEIKYFFVLNSIVLPHFKKEPKDVTVSKGASAYFDCQADGKPLPNISWANENLDALNDRRYTQFPNGTLWIKDVEKGDEGVYHCFITFNLYRAAELIVRETDESSSDDKIIGLKQDVFLVVIAVVVMVTVYATIMGLVFCLCCYCYKNNENNNTAHPYHKQGEGVSSPEPLKPPERADSLISRETIGKEPIPQLNYYDVPHPFSRVSSDGRSHDTMELIRVPPPQVVPMDNAAAANSHPQEMTDHRDNQHTNLPPVFPRSNLQFATKLGEGEFGPVYQGVAKELVPGETETLVAIKLWLHSRDGEEESASVDEDLSVFQSQMKLQYSNIASILAMCTDSRPYYIIYEFLDCGDLKKFLRNSSPDSSDQPPKLTQHSLLQIILQIADGMSYLSSNKIIHGDLAARNCLISSELRVKVADLGIGHDVHPDDYYDDGTQLLPIRWMPPEILPTAEFSIHSDMWSFGVVCWEVFSFGRQPYEMMSNEELLSMVPKGLQLDIPVEGCPNPLYSIMQECWSLQPEMRPKFARLCVAIIDLDLD